MRRALCVRCLWLLALGVLCLSLPDFSVARGHQGDHRAPRRLPFRALPPARLSPGRELGAVLGPLCSSSHGDHCSAMLVIRCLRTLILCVLSRLDGDRVPGGPCSVSGEAATPLPPSCTWGRPHLRGPSSSVRLPCCGSAPCCFAQTASEPHREDTREPGVGLQTERGEQRPALPLKGSEFSLGGGKETKGRIQANNQPS